MLNNKKMLAAPIVLVLLGLAYYFLYFIKTPGYAVNQIREAIMQKDTVKFQQYVDMDSVLDKAFDDLVIAESKINNDNIATNPFALSVFNMLKPAVVKLAKQEALNRIAPQAKATTQKVDDPLSDAMRRNIERKSHLDKLTFKSLKLDQEAKDKATVNVIFKNDELQKDFAMHLSMKKNNNDQWQVKEISNLAALVMQIDAANKAKQASENKQVLDRLKQNLSVNDKKLSVTMVKAGELAQNVAYSANTGGTSVKTIATNVVNEDTMEPCLTSKVLFKNISDKTIIRAYFDVEILDKDKKPFYSYPEHFDGVIAPNATKEVVAIKKLNLELPDDKTLANKKDQDLDCNIKVTYISFEDGSVIAPNQFMQY